MKRFFVLLSLCLLSQQIFAQSVGTFEQWQRSQEEDSTSNQSSQSAVIEFKGIPITGNVDDFAAKLQALGYNPLTVIDNVTVVMAGQFVNKDCIVFLNSTPKTKQIYNVFVDLKATYSSWTSIKSVYHKYKDLYIKKYGQPEKDLHFFLSPYREGDGCEMLALQNEKCSYFTMFKVSGGLISVSMFPSCSIGFQYENEVNADLHTTESESDMLNEI